MHVVAVAITPCARHARFGKWKVSILRTAEC
jgi:hypothetical protein